MAERIGPAGWVLATNIRRVREAQRLSYAELSRMVIKAGRHLPVLALQRIENYQRRIDFDDLLALAWVLRICPVDLMVSNEATDENYPLTTEREFEAHSVREWIRGEDVLVTPAERPGELFSSPAPPEMLDALRWMPEERRVRVLRNRLNMEEDQ